MAQLMAHSDDNTVGGVAVKRSAGDFVYPIAETDVHTEWCGDDTGKVMDGGGVWTAMTVGMRDCHGLMAYTSSAHTHIVVLAPPAPEQYSVCSLVAWSAQSWTSGKQASLMNSKICWKATLTSVSLSSCRSKWR